MQHIFLKFNLVIRLGRVYMSHYRAGRWDGESCGEAPGRKNPLPDPKLAGNPGSVVSLKSDSQLQNTHSIRSTHSLISLCYAYKRMYLQYLYTYIGIYIYICVCMYIYIYIGGVGETCWTCVLPIQSGADSWSLVRFVSSRGQLVKGLVEKPSTVELELEKGQELCQQFRFRCSVLGFLAYPAKKMVSGSWRYSFRKYDASICLRICFPLVGF